MKKPISVDAFFDELPIEIAVQFSQVRAIIRRLIPKAIEEIKYNVPFYISNGLFIYFSFHKKKNYVLGFCQGNLLQGEYQILKADNKQTYIRHWIPDGDNELNLNLISAYNMEAAEIQNKRRSFSKPDKKPLMPDSSSQLSIIRDKGFGE